MVRTKMENNTYSSLLLRTQFFLRVKKFICAWSRKNLFAVQNDALQDQREHCAESEACLHNWLSSPFLSIAFCVMCKTRPLAGKETPLMTTSSLSLAPTLKGGALEIMLTTTWLHSGMKAKDFLVWLYAKALARLSG